MAAVFLIGSRSGRRRREGGGGGGELAPDGGLKVQRDQVEKPAPVTSALLLGSFVALAFRSSEQEDEIEELEARKSSLRVANSAMSSIMWAWREELFKLAAMPSTSITAARLRHIYGEEDPLQ
ncbi:hypothetical protein ZWY2020_004536 [Hordeum vulgare]|nr:hypothetical protein ZWY2020_004536 [Hordeum vulgare]